MQSIVSYPDRGDGGRADYRGNFSPRLVYDLHEQFGFKSISDYMAGSYTTQAAAENLGIESHCYDLNHGFDLLSNDIPERNEMLIWHPPYWTAIQYSDAMYSARDVMERYGIDSNAADLSRIPKWEDFVAAMNSCCIKLFASLEKGGRMAVLIGDIKKKGRLYSMISEIAKPGTLENIVIKVQHNCSSYGKSYTGKFIPIVHEYLMICRKDGYIRVPVLLTSAREYDIREIRSASWKDTVYEVLKDAAATCSLEQIYGMLQYSRKTQSNPHWKEKIRQTLQLHPNLFVNKGRGLWAAA